MRVPNKNTWLSIIIGLAFVAIILRFIPPYVKPVLKLELHKNRGAISHLQQPRDITEILTYWVDHLNLHHRNGLIHPKLGPLGWNENFFVDLSSRFTLAQAGQYRFVVGSDDGFALKINGRTLCQQLNDQPYRRQSCQTHLAPGEHQLELTYFQGYGQAGLTLEFGSAQAGSSMHYWGQPIEGVTYQQEK